MSKAKHRRHKETDSEPQSTWDFEHRQEPLLPRSEYVRRVILGALVAVGLLAIWLLLGMFGYHWLAGLEWMDAFLNASMIVGGMGPVDVLHTSSAKLFAGIYAIMSGVVLLGLFGLIAAPVFHRFLHKFHLEAGDEA